MPTLSVCIIAKNEERNLANALASVIDFADEVIVTDTGSTDSTPEIAREFGLQVARFEWSDDLAAARNFCAGRATSEWILMLDADESLCEESRLELARCLEQRDVLAYSVIRQDIVDVAVPDAFTEMWQMRLVRNRPDLHMVGRIHEHFDPSLEIIAAREGLRVVESNVKLKHVGFSGRLRVEKLPRNRRLLELELRDRPNQFYYLVEYGIALLLSGNSAGDEILVQAARMVAEGNAQALGRGSSLAMLLEYRLANPQLSDAFPLSRNYAQQLALKYFPNAIPLLWHIAAEHNRRGEFAASARMLQRILMLGEKQCYDRLVSFAPSIMGEDARLNLGVCYVRLGELKRARDCFKALLQSPTRGKQAAENLLAVDQLMKLGNKAGRRKKP
jgi:glycosyltransferase involved in cell wall biosynthesis